MPLLTTFAGPSNKGGASSLLTGLVAFWKGDSTADSGPNGYTLTNTNSATFTSGKIGNAFTLVRASSQSLLRADNADLSMGSTDFSISLWAKWASEPTFCGIIAKGNAEGSGGEWMLTYRSSVDKVRWTVRKTDNSTSDFIDNETLIDTGVWYHIVATFTHATDSAVIYINNANPATKSLSGGGYGLDGSSNVTIGLWPGGGNFDGQIDAVGIWRKVLSAGERATLYQGGTGLEYPF